MSCVTGLHGGVPRDRQGQVKGGTACREYHPHQPAARRRGLACMHYIIRIPVLSSTIQTVHHYFTVNLNLTLTLFILKTLGPMVIEILQSPSVSKTTRFGW